jgi:hypothetical protein
MIKYVVGDLFQFLPYETPMEKFIPHVCNNIYGWGSGFVVPLAKKWPETREAYKSLPNLKLGEVQFVAVPANEHLLNSIWVCNMIAQNRTISPENPKPIKYAALVSCMQRIAEACRTKTSPEIHCPKFGSDLAGGNWNFIEELIQEIWGEFEVTVYKLEE